MIRLKKWKLFFFFLYFCHISIQAKSPCTRHLPGSTLEAPKDLFSQNGELRVELHYLEGVGSDGQVQYCYLTPAGDISPTLHVKPGEHLILTLKNESSGVIPVAQSEMSGMKEDAVCGTTGKSPTNLHFHGTHTSPSYRQDESIHTAIYPGEMLTYDLKIPPDQAAGLYWYHPHVHGRVEAAVQGGASGAIVVEGIQNNFPQIVGIPEQILVFRDQPLPKGTPESDVSPAWDLTLNFTPIPFPYYPPVVLSMKPLEKQFFRVLNASAGTFLDLQFLFDGQAQMLSVLALDGVSVNSNKGKALGRAIELNHVFIPPAGRVEFVVTGPAQSVKEAVLVTRKVDTGAEGDSDPERPLATIKTNLDFEKKYRQIPPLSEIKEESARGFEVDQMSVSTQRSFFFSEARSELGNPKSSMNFFLTTEGQIPKTFSPSDPPSVVTTQGNVEDWIIENRSAESHVFHIHQIHFLFIERDGVELSQAERQYMDVVNIPPWSGTGPFPKVKLRMDFRGDIVGDFVYHCHLLEHEDGGMMAKIRVLPLTK